MLPAVRLSQALLLSIGGEPDDWPECGIQEVGQLLLERRRIAISHLRAGNLPLLELYEAEPIESTVLLADFAAWARALAWQLPAKFPCSPSAIRYADLPYWLATKQRAGHVFKDQLYRGMLRLNWEGDLRKAVQRGQLQVRTPATREPIDTPYDDAVVLVADLLPFLESRGLAHLLQPIERAEASSASETFDAQAGIDAPEHETPEARRARVRARYDEVRATGVRDYAKRVADEEGITTARLRQILREKRERKLASPFDGLIKR